MSPFAEAMGPDVEGRSYGGQIRWLAEHHPEKAAVSVVAEMQRAIVSETPSPYRVLLYRRMMLRIAAALAQQLHAHGLVTGDSLAQVASQTVMNLEAISTATTLPIYRPLIGDDKIAIQAEARRLGTFDISSQQVDDCCSAFLPRSPALAATPHDLATAEAPLDLPALTAASLASLEQRRLGLKGGEPVTAG